jgi:hypothetical protein
MPYSSHLLVFVAAKDADLRRSLFQQSIDDLMSERAGAAGYQDMFAGE